MGCEARMLGTGESYCGPVAGLRIEGVKERGRRRRNRVKVAIDAKITKLSNLRDLIMPPAWLRRGLLEVMHGSGKDELIAIAFQSRQVRTSNIQRSRLQA